MVKVRNFALAGRSVFIFGLFGLSAHSSESRSEINNSEIDQTVYLSCDEFRIIKADDGFSFYDNQNRLIFDHEGKSLSFRIAPSTSSGRKQCGVPIGIKKGNKYGIIMSNGELFAGRLFENSRGLYNNVLAFSENNNWGLIDRKGTIITKPSFESIRWYGEGKFIVDEKLSDAFLIDTTGKRSRLEDDPNYSIKYRQHLPPREEYLKCSKNLKIEKRMGQWGVLDEQGEIIVPFLFRAMTCPQESIIMVPFDNIQKWCAIVGRQAYLDVDNCVKEYHVGGTFHHFPEKLSVDRYESSVLWQKAYLDYGKGLVSEPPKYIPDGVMAHRVLLAAPSYSY